MPNAIHAICWRPRGFASEERDSHVPRLPQREPVRASSRFPAVVSVGENDGVTVKKGGGADASLKDPKVPSARTRRLGSGRTRRCVTGC